MEHYNVNNRIMLCTIALYIHHLTLIATLLFFALSAALPISPSSRDGGAPPKRSLAENMGNHGNISKSSASGANHIYFMGREYDRASWHSVKQKVWGQTSHGWWSEKPTAAMNVYNRSLDIQAPCDTVYRTNPYSVQGRCGSFFHGRALDYNWHVGNKNVPLYPFNLNKTCSILDRSGGNVVFVGDSIQHEMSASFAFQFYRYVQKHVDPTATCSLCYHMCTIASSTPIPCPATTRKYFQYIVRNDVLMLNEASYSNVAHNIHCQPWFYELGRVNASLVVLNRGAHFIGTNETIAELNVTLHAITTTYPNISIVWRTTPPGHKDVSLNFFAAPLTEYTDVPHMYNWEQFNSQNKEVVQFLHRYYPQVLILDLATPMALRADSHVDGLHYCLPGPLDTWAILLLNALYIADDHDTSQR